MLISLSVVFVLVKWSVVVFFILEVVFVIRVFFLVRDMSLEIGFFIGIFMGYYEFVFYKVCGD